MAKLTRGCLARDNRKTDSLPDRCVVFIPHGMPIKRNVGWFVTTGGQETAINVEDFLEQYDCIYQINGKDTGETWPLPRPGQVIEDVWIEL